MQRPCISALPISPCGAHRRGTAGIRGRWDDARAAAGGAAGGEESVQECDSLLSDASVNRGAHPLAASRLQAASPTPAPSLTLYQDWTTSPGPSWRAGSSRAPANARCSPNRSADSMAEALHVKAGVGWFIQGARAQGIDTNRQGIVDQPEGDGRRWCMGPPAVAESVTLLSLTSTPADPFPLSFPNTHTHTHTHTHTCCIRCPCPQGPAPK